MVLLGRLAVRDLRRQPGQAVLLLLAICAATATLTIGLALHGVTAAPYQQTRVSTAGPDVVAITIPPKPGQAGSAASPAALHALSAAPGVTGHSGPFPVTWTLLRAGGISTAVMAEGRDFDQARIDRPRLTAGRWASRGSLVVERSFADAVGLRTGDLVRLNGRSFLVAGVAVTAAIPVYPQVCSFACVLSGKLDSFNPGLVWLTSADTRSLASRTEPLSYLMDYRLANPASADAFATGHATAAVAGPYLISWPNIARQDGLVVTIEQRVLLAGSWLLALLAIASITVLVGGRMAAQTRRVGLLKAVGATPGLVAAVLLVEHLAVALIASAAGLAVGWLAAPLLTNAGAGLLGSAPGPSITVPDAGLVVAAALAVAVAATLVPAVRAARISTVRALNDAARSPHRSRWLIAISAYFPVPVLLGIRLAARRPRRMLANAVSTFVTVSGIIAVLVVHSSDDQQLGGASGVSDPQTAMLNEVTFVLTIMLVILACANAVFITWGTVLDARHSSALQRALGATGWQVAFGLSAAQLLPALAGAIAGIPGGIGLYSVAKNGGSTIIPPAWWLLAAVLGTLVALASLTAIPARVGARRPPAEMLAAT